MVGNQLYHGKIKSVNSVTITLYRLAAGYHNNSINVGFALSPVRAFGGTYDQIKGYVSSHYYGTMGCSAGAGWKTFSGGFLPQLVYDFFNSDAQAIALYNGETSGGYYGSANYAKFSEATWDVSLTYVP